MPWQNVRLRPTPTRAVQYNPPGEPVADLVIDNGANQRLIFVAQGEVAYIAPGNWIVDMPTGYRVLTDAEFKRLYVPESGEWPE